MAKPSSEIKISIKNDKEIASNKNNEHNGINKIILHENIHHSQHKIIATEVGLTKSEEHKISEDHPKKDLEENEVSNSLSGAIFEMTSLSIGTGCLTFTKKVIQFGFVWFGVVLIIGGIATYWTLAGLIRAAKKEKDSEYSSVVRKAIGKFPGVLVDVMTCIYSWGLIITYEIIMDSLVGRVAYAFFIDKDDFATFSDYEEQKWNKLKIKVIVLVSINVLLVPLCLKRDIGKMKFFSLFGIIALSYTVLVLVIECPFFWKDYLNNVYKKDDKSTHANWFDISKAFNPNLDFFTGFATIVFSFSCHQGALPVYRSLEPNNEKTMNKIFIRSIILDLIIYFLIYISSFLTSPLKSNDLIIYRDSIFHNDIFMHISLISIFLELFFLIPSNYNSFRCSLFHIIFGNEHITTIPNIILTIITLFISAVIGTLYSEITNYISLLGGFCCTTFSFFVPGWLMIKVEWGEMSKIKRILSIIGISLLSLVGFIGGIMSIIICFRGRV